MFKDQDGNISSMRVMSFLVLLIILFNWTYHNVTTGTYVQLNLGEALLAVGSMGAKAYQRGKGG